MDKTAIVKGALKASKGKTTKVTVVNKPTVTIENKPIRMQPTLHLSSQDLAAIKNWKVGQTYKLALEVKMTSLRQGNDYEIVDRPDTSTNAGFKVTKVSQS